MQPTVERPDVAGEPTARLRLQHAFTAQERKSILDSVLLDRVPRWRARFTVMLVLSVIIAALGLLGDSPAIVIGAMLIAPLLMPIQALAVALAMGWGRRAIRYALVVVVASAGGVALAYVIGVLVPPASALPNEVLIRTSPDLRDLFIALAAGAAGAYATVREDVSTALPGVAVAVALVPPLATIGVTLSIGHGELAVGAVLLYVTNLVAILFAAIMVLFVTGFVPDRHLRKVLPRVAGGVAVVAFSMILIGLPLTTALADATSAAQRRERVASAVVAWLRPVELEMTGLHLDGTSVRVDVTGPEAPPPVDALATRLDDLFGTSAEISVRWSQSALVAPGSVDSRADPELQEIRREVLDWIHQHGGEHRLLDVQRDGDRVILDLAGPTPPDTASVMEALSSHGAAPSQLQVRWSLERLLDADAERAADEAEIRAAVDDWASAWPELTVDDVTVTAAEVIVVASGDGEPDDVDRLDAAVAAASTRRRSVEVQFRQVRSITGADATRRRVERAATTWAVQQGVDLVQVAGRGETREVTLTGPVDVASLGALSDGVADALGASVALMVRTPTATYGPVPGLAPADRNPIATLQFAPRGTRSGSEHDPDLARVAEALATRPGASLVLIGHSDTDGAASWNYRLSLRRANDVARRLVALGIGAERVQVRADGEQGQPGRRVDLLLVER